MDINNSFNQKENLKLEIPINHEQNINLFDKQPSSIEEKLKFITDKKLAQMNGRRLDPRMDKHF